MADDQDLEHEIFCVLRAQSGSHEALNELFKLLQEPLFRYLKNLVREEFKAEDILQEVFIRIYRKLRWLREPRALRSWAFQIATREAFRYLKREKHFHETSDEEFLVQTPSSETENFPREMIEQLPGLIGNLSPASRAVNCSVLLERVVTKRNCGRVGDSGRHGQIKTCVWIGKAATRT